MTKYFSSLIKLTEFLKEESETSHQIWFRNFIFKGYTAPWLSNTSDIPRSSVVTNLFLYSDDVGKLKIENSLKAIYKNPRIDIYNQGFIELLTSIAFLNITSLFPDIYRLALKGYFKDKKSDYISDSLDFHTYILKVLFGLSYERQELKSLISIATRDIIDSRYMLECFNFLLHTPKGEKNCVKYLPYLLEQNQDNVRDYEGAVISFLTILGENNLIDRIMKVIKILDSFESFVLLNKFQNILLVNGIHINKKEEPKAIFEIFFKNKLFEVANRYKKQISSLFRAQENSEIRVLYNEILVKNGKKGLVDFLRTFKKAG